jgi:CRISPR/Cas system endoribonuclease Cas6 (RAMP superfamily)
MLTRLVSETAGSLWQLGFSDDTDKSVQVFALDCGLGERNSLGFGFINELSNPSL